MVAVIENQFPVDFHVLFECHRETFREINIQCNYALFAGVIKIDKVCFFTIKVAYGIKSAFATAVEEEV